MNDRELEHLLADLESDCAERKESLKQKDEVCKAICAFANDLPNYRKQGVIFIGAKNDGTCANLAITDKLLLDLSNIRSDGNILPLPTIYVEKKNIKGCEMALVRVEPSSDTPVHYRGRVWVRVGPSTRIASAEEERRLNEKRRSRDLPFDLRAVVSATLEDLNADFFRSTYLPQTIPAEILAQNNRSMPEQLASLRFATAGPQPKPTYTGLLVVGKDPLAFLPGAYVQFVRYAGTQLTDPIKDEKLISGPLPDLFRMLEEVLKINISASVDFTSQPTEIRHPDFPMVALQQLTRNAVLHRNYEGTNAPIRINWFSDRIEILSPGGPFGQVTLENFGQPNMTDYRNPHLAEAMKNLGYIQKFGVGILQARQALEQNGNPPPEFMAEPTHVLVILRAKP